MELNKELLKDVRILVVEDDSDSREITRFVLQQTGASVVAVESVNEAFEAFSQMQPSIVVTDIAMPGYNGYALIAQIREEDRKEGKSTPVIALTAYTSDADREQALAAGFQEYMSKPFHPAELIATVCKWVGSKKEPAA